MKEKLKAYWEYVVLPVGTAVVFFMLAYTCATLVFVQLGM
jgi:hypothetical protein